MVDLLRCRWCGRAELTVVLDLGLQPAADLFPLPTDPTPDPVFPLRMAVCDHCGLAQIVEDPTVPEPPMGREPAALVEQAREAVAAVVDAGLIRAGTTFVEFDSPHGGSWCEPLTAAGAIDVTDKAQRADLVVDVFGMMHAADQRAALRERLDRLEHNGTLLLQYQPLRTIVEMRQWNALRHGHMAYYSTTALAGMLGSVGLATAMAWEFPLYGGTILLAAGRTAASDGSAGRFLRDEDVRPEFAARLSATVRRMADETRQWLIAQREQGRRIYGYGAASRAVPLLVAAGIGPDLLPAVADAAEQKWGRTIPGVRIPIISPTELIAASPDEVVLFVPDLLNEVRRDLPDIRRWTVPGATSG
jgi:hypothetical protein